MRRKRGLALAATALVAGVLAVHGVSATPTPEDRAAAERILAEAGYSGANRDFGDLGRFDNQLRAIRAVQEAVIRAAPLDAAIPFGQPREPADLLALRRGECFDRSRSIEKVLASLGLEVRHVSVYATVKRNALAAVVTPGNDSHALTEVRTAKGWMAVDPNVRWVGLTADGVVVSVAGLRVQDLAKVRWAVAPLEPGAGPGGSDTTPVPHPIFGEPYTYVIGLYSRHGRFYPPYTLLPDVNWRQLVQNFGG